MGFDSKCDFTPPTLLLGLLLCPWSGVSPHSCSSAMQPPLQHRTAHHFLANRWETVETVTDFLFLGSKITADGDCSHEIKRCLFLGRKAMINLDSILKSRDITLLTKVHPVKAMVFPLVMYGCESWNIKKAEPQRIYAFELWCWR